MDLIKVLRENRAAKQKELDELLKAPADEKRDLNADESTKFAELRDELQHFDDRIAEMEQLAERNAAAADAGAKGGDPTVTVRSEEMTYRKGGEHSYFRDLAKSQDPGGADFGARERLQRHAKEMDVELRANMNRTDGTGGEFVPPLWLIGDYVKLARAGRVTADLCRRLPLPPGTDSINLPTVATGTAVAIQTADGASIQKTDMTTASVSAGVKTIAGQQVFAMQLLDQSPINFDEVVFADLVADHAKKTDDQVLNGSNAAGQVKGLRNVGGIVSVTYTDATPTVPELYPKVADAIQQIATNRFLGAQCIVMHPRRWAWFLAALDGQQRPLVVPNGQGPTNAFAGMDDVRAEGSVGTLQGLPVYIDPNIPTNLGAGTNEDVILVLRADDLYLYEGALRSRVLFETDADTLSVRLQVWNYLAFLPDRYPKSIATVGGTGLITPTF